jgi:hypothetical protein
MCIMMILGSLFLMYCIKYHIELKFVRNTWVDAQE